MFAHYVNLSRSCSVMVWYTALRKLVLFQSLHTIQSSITVEVDIKTVLQPVSPANMSPYERSFSNSYNEIVDFTVLSRAFKQGLAFATRIECLRKWTQALQISCLNNTKVTKHPAGVAVSVAIKCS